MNFEYIHGNSEVYKFVLNQFYEYHPTPIHLSNWMQSIANQNKSLANPLLDVISKMKGHELEMINATDAILTTKGIEAAKQITKKKDCD